MVTIETSQVSMLDWAFYVVFAGFVFEVLLLFLFCSVFFKQILLSFNSK